MAFTMTIAGVDVVPYLDVDSFDVSRALNARHTLSARLEDEDGSYRPLLLQEVIVAQDGTTVFGGYVTDATEVDFAVEQGIATEIQAADYSLRLDHVYVSLTTEAGDTVRDVVDALLAAVDDPTWAITRDPAMAAGPTLEAQTFTDVTLSAALNHLSALTGWPWRVSYTKTLVMAAVGTESAPAALVDGVTALILGPAGRTVGEYRNRQMVRIGSGTREITHTLTGDGSTRVFSLPIASATRPAQLYDPVALTYAHVGVHGVDTLFEWTYRSSDNAIVQLAEAPPGTPHAPLGVGVTRQTVGYVAQYPFTVQEQDGSEIVARGLWEGAPVDAPDVFDAATGSELAAALIRRYGTWPPPRELTVVLWAAGYAPGQQVGVTSTTRSLWGNWLITAIDIAVRNGMFLEYRLQLLEGIEQQAGWREYWRGLSGAGGGGGTIVGGILGGAPPTVVPSPYHASLGGSSLQAVSHTTWADVPDWRDWICPRSGTYTCRVEVWTSDVATAVTPRLYDVTSAAAAVTGTASSTTARAEQVLSFAATAGYRYRLQLLAANTNHPVYGVGAIEA